MCFIGWYGKRIATESEITEAQRIQVEMCVEPLIDANFLRRSGSELRVIFDDPLKTLELLGSSTATIERTHLTMRLFNGRLARKTLAFSKQVAMYRASAAWEDLVYNLARPLKTLRLPVGGDAKRRWKQRSPGMASGLTDHIWTVKELLKTVVPPSLNNT